MADRRRAWLVAPLLFALGCAARPGAASPTSEAAAPASTTTPVTVAAAVHDFEASHDYRTDPPPVAVEVPAVGISSGLEELHRKPDGTIAVPSWHVAGWWADGPKPGQPGPAVILGHVDSRHGPDVFYRLGDVRPGDQVVVTRADGTTVRFTVERVERVPKGSFPTAAVFAPSLTAGLRLVTCGGDFDRVAGHYDENVIVFARPAG
jgi:hypothetical protein